MKAEDREGSLMGADRELNQLSEYLANLQPGAVSDCGKLVSLLEPCWGLFSGGEDTKMRGYKLARLEDAVWDPPKLHFTLERHGGRSLGSKRAELQLWTADVGTMTAVVEEEGRFRQLDPNQPRLDVRPFAEEIVTLIVERRDDLRLKWYPDGSVQVRIGQVLPEEGVVQQTRSGRRKRISGVVRTLLGAEGWFSVEGRAPHTYAKRPE